MTRDTSTQLGTSELRDVSLAPSAVRPANISIIHPQLRDLILPVGRGHVLYPHGPTIEEQRWQDDDPGKGRTRMLYKLSFTPSCLTTHGAILAAGGQKGELFLTDYHIGPLSREPPVKPFTHVVTVQSRQINNSITILPSWPRGWLNRQAEVKRQYVGYSKRRTAMDIEAEADEEDDKEEDGDESGSDAEDGGAPWDVEGWLELDEEDDDEPPLATSPATYPNTLPFGANPRIPRRGQPHAHAHGHGHAHHGQRRLSGPQYVTSQTTGRSSPASSTASSHRRLRRLEEPRIMVSNNDQTVRMFALRRLNPDDETASASASTSASFSRPTSTWAASAATDRRDRRVGQLTRNNDSNNSLPQSDSWASVSSMGSDHSWVSVTPNVSALRYTAEHPDSRYQHMMDTIGMLRHRATSIPPSHPRNLFGELSYPSLDAAPAPAQPHDAAADADAVFRGRAVHPNFPGFQRPSSAIYHSARHANPPPDPSSSPAGSSSSPAMPRPMPGRQPSQEIGLRANRYLGESVSAYRDRNPEGEAADEARAQRNLEAREERAALLQRATEDSSCRLAAVGGSKFRTAVNHSSLSPDLRTMVTVGDSTDVFLYEVIDGGREFRRIGTYNAATDSGFSTSWSKDGRKFAVASQDGQVTVWDHRSSQPLAVFHTSPSSTTPDYNDLPRLMEPPVGSQSGREPARVVKFSPEGSARDLLVFSEELTNIHIVDARTFNTHVVVPVPFDSPACPPLVKRHGVDSGQWGVAGVAFDPSGDWLYAGTERTVVEWDLRRYGGGEGGTWSMA